MGRSAQHLLKKTRKQSSLRDVFISTDISCLYLPTCRHYTSRTDRPDTFRSHEGVQSLRTYRIFSWPWHPPFDLMKSIEGPHGIALCLLSWLMIQPVSLYFKFKVFKSTCKAFLRSRPRHVAHGIPHFSW